MSMASVGDIITLTKYYDMPDGTRKLMPYLKVDPVTRQCKTNTQRFRVDSLDENGIPHRLSPVHEDHP